MPNPALWRLALAALAALVLAMPATASANRTVPQGFYGMNWDLEVSYRSSAQTRTEQFGKMAAAGAESVRTAFVWSAAQPDESSPIDFRATDAVVALAASHGLEVIPVVEQAPRWARQSNAEMSPPNKKGVGAYTDYLRAILDRYGPNGNFWLQHKNLQKHPIRKLQICNEPSAKYQWDIPEGQDWAPGYAKLLKASYKAIKDTDPGAKVVLAGLPNTSPQDLDHLYKKGKIHGFFDIAAIHPYTAQKGGVLTLTKQFKDVMKKHGDGGKKLWVTELGLPASKGKTDDQSSLQTDDAGMAKFLTASYKDLMNNRQSLKIDHVFWYTWASVYKGWIFKWTGLWRYTRDHGNDVFQEKPAFKAYRKLARAAEGCTKGTNGACAQRR